MIEDAAAAGPSEATPAGAIEDALAQPTLCAAFQVTAAADGDRVALRTHGTEVELTWAGYAARVRAIATGFAALGVAAGDTVGIMLTGRSEFHLVDTALLHISGVPFSIYFSNPPEQIVPLIENSGARIVVTEPQFAGKLAAVRGRVGLPERIVVVGDDAGDGDMTLGDLEALPAPRGFDFEAAWRAVTPGTLAALIYTSGTTGAPKGAQWSHGALLQNVRNAHGHTPASPAGRVVSYLPMAHLAERWFSHYGQIGLGYTVTNVPDPPKQLGAAIAATRPTRFFGVPRIYEKLAAAVHGLADADTTLQTALATGMAGAAAELAGTLDADLATARDAARRTLAPVRERLGFGATEYLGSAAAAAREDILQTFDALGLPIAEIWGMSETAMSLSNPHGKIKIGKVGVPMPGFEAKLAGDGELLVRGPIFSGYRNDPEKTREAVDDEGWMHSGDIATVDEDGYYRIVDRKKEIIINSAGKNIPPAMVENRIKQHSPLIAQAVALGDRQPYLTALVVLDEERVQAFAARHGLSGTFAELCRDPAVRAELDRGVAAANETLARIEQVKRFRVVEGTWLPGGDELTHTMKLKRRVIAEKYADDIAALYA